MYLDSNDLNKYLFLGFDPGRNKPISTCTIDDADMPENWKDEKRIHTLDKSIQENSATQHIFQTTNIE